MRWRELGQARVLDLPAAVADGAGKRRLADDITGQAHRARVEIFLQRETAAFRFAAHRLDGEMLAQHHAAAVVHEARGRADIAVGVIGDVFLDEIDETRVALQKAQQLQRADGAGLGQHERRGIRSGSRHRFDGRDGGLRRLGHFRGFAQIALHAAREAGVAENPEEGAEGNGNPAEEGRIRIGHVMLLLAA